MSIIEVKNLNKTYGIGRTEVRAINDISFEAKEGDIILIMGPSGSGKTTLITIIGGLLKPTSGSVAVLGQNINLFSEKEITQFRLRSLGFIFQSFNLIASLSAQENTMLPLLARGVGKKEAKKAAKDILERLELGSRLNNLPKNLSGGEKQRGSIARALINDPKIILADEPTANLDSKNGHKIMEILKNIAKNQQKTVIIVSHDMRIIDIADRTLWLEDGKIKEGEMIIVIDPVCEMKLQKETAPYNLQIGENTYYFCGKKCKEAYEKRI